MPPGALRQHLGQQIKTLVWQQTAEAQQARWAAGAVAHGHVESEGWVFERDQRAGKRPAAQADADMIAQHCQTVRHGAQQALQQHLAREAVTGMGIGIMDDHNKASTQQTQREAHQRIERARHGTDRKVGPDPAEPEQQERQRELAR